MLRTKIVATIGPASENKDLLIQMIKSGMRVARLNFSHGVYEEHAKRIRLIREAEQETGIPVGILLDTKGPEIRLGLLEGGKALLQEEEVVALYPEDGSKGTARRLPITYSLLAQDIAPGNRILIDDGKIGLEVFKIEDSNIFCRVVFGGEVSDRKGVSVPGAALRMPAISEKEIKDLTFGIEQKVDFVAISFVRNASDVLGIRRIIEERGGDLVLIAKIENHQGVENIEEILQVADGIMVARGDLGVDIPTEDVPLVQKRIIKKCNRLGKPVITATQMLDSMMRNPRPTRAEATDVANAIFDGTDAIMLSGETAAGKYPLESVETMAKIAQRAEAALPYDEILRLHSLDMGQNNVTDAISYATCSTAKALEAKAILTLTKSGFTARMISRYRPEADIIAATTEENVLRKMTVVWGIKTILVKEANGTDEMIQGAVGKSLSRGLISSGEILVITAGVPVGIPGTTNLLKVHIAGNVVARGVGIGTKTGLGRIKVCKTAEDIATMEEGAVLVAIGTDKEFIPAIEKCAGIITEEGGLTSHAAIVGLHYNIPVIVGVETATSLFSNGQVVTLDPMRGQIYTGIARVL